MYTLIDYRPNMMNLILTIVNKKSSHLIYVLISLNKERKSKASDENHFHLFKNIDNTDDLLNSKINTLG